MAKLPITMRSLAAPEYCEPSSYEIMDLPVPSINGPTEILIKVHAAGLMGGDTAVASGNMRLMAGQTAFPIPLGEECAGVVVDVGSAVTAFKPGDEVYGAAHGHPVDLTWNPGYCSEYCIGLESRFLLKPSSISFEEAAALLIFTVSAVQSIGLGARRLAEAGHTLEGKTVFVPGALSPSGFIGIQILKNVYGVGKLITTVSTPKLGLVEQHLSCLVDQVVDYTATRRLEDAIAPGSVDFMYNTKWNMEAAIPLLNKDHGVIASIASMPSSALLDTMVQQRLWFFVYWFANLAQLWYKWKLGGTQIVHDFTSVNLSVREDVERAGELIATGKVKAVMTVVALEDLGAVRKACGLVRSGKGGVGKLVIKVV